MKKQLTPAQKALVRIDKSDIDIIISLANKSGFWDKINRHDESGCWLWTRGVDKDGYGKLTVGYRDFRAHRISYILSKGEIPEGLLVCHSCDNPLCCNPDHLFLGTVADNDRDRDTKRHGSFQGERNPKAKLNRDQVDEIRDKADRLKIPYKILADEYGVSASQISTIVTRRQWK